MMRAWFSCVLLCACHPDNTTTDLAVADLAVAQCPGGSCDMAVECGGGSCDMASTDQSVPDDAEMLVTYSQFVAAAAQARCANQLACQRISASDMTRCVEWAKRFQPPISTTDFDGEVAAGRLGVNQLQCAAALMSARCDGSDNGFVEDKCIRLLFKPHVQLSGTCVDTVECENSYCQHSKGGSGCPGVCTSYAAVNALCPVGDECDPSSAFCSSDTAVCPSGSCCQSFAALGAAGKCNGLIHCAPGQYCAGALLEASGDNHVGTCTLPVKEGAEGDACDPLQGNTTPIPSCNADLFCKTTPSAKYGSPFIMAQGICTKKVSQGSLCIPGEVALSTESSCVDGTACWDNGGGMTRCNPLALKDAACVDGFCQTTYFCNTTCKPMLDDGGPCDPNNVPFFDQTCLSGFCVQNMFDDGGTATAACTPFKSFGGACDSALEGTAVNGSPNSECFPGACVNAKCGPICM
jgi:hypothetical protein